MIKSALKSDVLMYVGGEKFDFGTSAEDTSGLKVLEANFFVLHTISRVVGKVQMLDLPILNFSEIRRRGKKGSS